LPLPAALQPIERSTGRYRSAREERQFPRTASAAKIIAVRKYAARTPLSAAPFHPAKSNSGAWALLGAM
jgi:hypothetical protein